MGQLESENRKDIRATKIQKAILSTVAAAGVISVTMLAPNAFQALKIFGLDKKLIRNKTRSVNISRERLVKNGLLEYSAEGFLSLTEAGRKVLSKLEARNYKIALPKRWDKKWRMLVFDIKESKRGLRDKIRNTLIDIGFIKLQNSVWVYPYDCEDLITLLKADFEIGKEVLYVIADRIENEKVLLESFGLEK